MKERQPVHDLPSFDRYLAKVFSFRARAQQLADARHDPEISPAAVFLAMFHGFVFRRSSIRQLEGDLAEPLFQKWIGAERVFGDDVLRYSLCGFQADGIEQMLVDTNRRLKRNKAFDAGRCQGHLVAALDGIEVLSSYSRCCQLCAQRRVTKTDAQGNQQEEIQYYHRAVGCQIVSSPVKAFLGIEWVLPGEGEDTAAFRLLSRLAELYGSPFFDILLLDSLYAQAPALKLAKQIGWRLVISLKQENRDLYRDAMGLFANRPPDDCFTEQNDGQSRDVRLWEQAALPFTKDYPEPVRVIRSEEEVTERHYRQGRLQAETAHHQWVWIDTLNPHAFSARTVRQLGHDRWKQENNGWNDLTQNWAFKHGFIHACKHRPKQQAADGSVQPVSNRALAAVTLIALLAFNLSAAFCLLHSKLRRLYDISLLEVSRQLYRSLWQLPLIRAPS